MAGQKPQIPRSHFPDDVILKILARLSVKSLLRFRCICKSWNSNITNPYFIATHLKQSKDRLLYTAFLKEQYCLGVCDEGYNKILEIGNSFPFSSGFIQLAGSRNGLLCLVVRDCVGYSYWRPEADMVYLWNYSTRKLKTLPSTCLRLSGRFKRNSYGFAYDSENDDYKIVRTTLDSWLGPRHWKAESELPPRLSVEMDEMKRVGDLANLCEYKGKLGLFICTYANGRPPIYTNISIWVMRDCGVAESWTKSVVVQFHEPVGFLGGTEDGALVIRKLSDWSKTILVRPETSSKKFVVVHPISCTTSWKESLVPLKGTNVISWNREIEYLNSWNPEIEYLKSGVVLVSNLGLK
ncbi:hypothetical protein CJ030_MR1G008824 [Morella rubra]|uniref:F-box domain-containing protein n=1 Tax=Morella rubra TaxID=262757 RepID=A0A6A1WHZ4_9ROSI|nr:hypothetical protein CJ030_MR1G008824 [Morella rubra]